MLPAPNERAEDNVANRIFGAADKLSAVIFNRMGRQQNLPRGCSPPAQENTRAANAISLMYSATSFASKGIPLIQCLNLRDALRSSKASENGNAPLFIASRNGR
jgi:hypothetical protein